MRLPVLCLSIALAAMPAWARVADPLDATVKSADVELFFRIYDAADSKPDAAALQPYLDQGSPGVQDFIPNRIVSADNLAKVIADKPEIYAAARACAGELGAVKERVRAGFLALKQLYPVATFPETYILIGADNSGGTASDNALMIGLEVMCRPGAPDPAPLDVRLMHIIVHEAMHALQTNDGDDAQSVLEISIVEGVADFLTELATGRTSNPQLFEWTKGREAEIEQRFAAEMRGKTFKDWIYNGRGTPEAPGDLGYWVGYRIAAAYYAKAADKRAAIAEMLAVTDPEAFLAASGWQPAAQ